MVDEKLTSSASAEFHRSKVPGKTISCDGDSTGFPGSETAITESDAREMLRSQYSGARLLVVEDKPANREAILKLIQAAALNVDMAENGQQAVEKASRMHYDLILMDVQMPIMNGLEASRAIRLQPDGGAVPILAMTASTFAEARPACLGAGMQDFVAKPLDPEAFYAALLKWLPTTEQRADSHGPVAAIHSGHTAQLQALAAISGLDVDSGLATMRGNVAKYSDALKLLAEQARKHAEKLSGMHDQVEFSATERLAASFRGNATMLGARKVAELAGAVVSACRLNTGTKATSALCTILINELLKLADGIQEAIPESLAISNTDIDPLQLAETLTQLETFLEYGNIEANRLAREKSGLLLAAFGKSAKVFLARIEAFDYENAVTELRQFRIRLNDHAG